MNWGQLLKVHPEDYADKLRAAGLGKICGEEMKRLDTTGEESKMSEKIINNIDQDSAEKNYFDSEPPCDFLIHDNPDPGNGPRTFTVSMLTRSALL